MKPGEQHNEQFSLYERAAAELEPAWLGPLRRAAMLRFEELGFPSTEIEDWRSTNVAPIAALPFRPLWRSLGADVMADGVSDLPMASLGGNRLVFINGSFCAAASAVRSSGEGVRIMNLASVIREDGGAIQERLLAAGNGEDAFGALNLAFFTDGVFIEVPAGRAVEEPVHAVFVSTSLEAGATAHVRNLVLAGQGARCTVIETYVGRGADKFLTNAVTELKAGNGAVVEHCRLQDEAPGSFHVARLRAELGRNTLVRSHSMALGARLSRYDLGAALAGDGSECVLNGLYLAKGDQLVDHHMVVDHALPHGTSHEYFNGILGGRAKGVFHGRILVRPRAQKTDAKQTNKNMLLSPDATVDTKPQLEIYADDVRCTHGATVGQLDPEAVFYLQSRGIDQDQARRMLVHAFAGEIIERVACRLLREELDRLVWARLEELAQAASIRPSEQGPAASL